MVCLGFEPGAAGWKAANESTELPRHPFLGRVLRRLFSVLRRSSAMNVKWETPKGTEISSIYLIFAVAISVTRLGDFLHFGQLFKAFGNNYFAQFSQILSQFFEGVKIYHLSSEIIFGQFL